MKGIIAFMIHGSNKFTHAPTVLLILGIFLALLPSFLTYYFGTAFLDYIGSLFTDNDYLMERTGRKILNLLIVGGGLLAGFPFLLRNRGVMAFIKSAAVTSAVVIVGLIAFFSIWFDIASQ